MVGGVSGAWDAGEWESAGGLRVGFERLPASSTTRPGLSPDGGSPGLNSDGGLPGLYTEGRVQGLYTDGGSEDAGSDSDTEGGEGSGEESEADLALDEDDGLSSMRQLMAAMDAELWVKAKGVDLATQAAGDMAGGHGGGSAGGAAAGAGGGGLDAGGGVGPVDVDLNLVQNLLAAHSAQGGLPGPASNLLASLGIVLPPDADAVPEGVEPRR